MFTSPACPRCSAKLRIVKRWLGLKRKYPKHCHACGAKLVYDLAGGIYVLDEPGESEESFGDGREPAPPGDLDDGR